MTIGERIAKCRKDKNLSQEYVADSLGISRQAVSKWEQNITSPDTNNLIALSELLGVSIEYIACGKEKTADVAPPATDKRSQIFKISGIVLFALGLIALVVGFIVTPILSMLGGLLISFGVLFITFEKSGMLISLGITLLCAILTLTVGLNDDDYAVLIIAYAALIAMVLALVAIIVSIFKKGSAKKSN